MKKYTQPELKEIEIEIEDIVASSNLFNSQPGDSKGPWGGFPTSNKVPSMNE